MRAFATNASPIIETIALISTPMTIRTIGATASISTSVNPACRRLRFIWCLWTNSDCTGDLLFCYCVIGDSN